MTFQFKPLSVAWAAATAVAAIVASAPAAAVPLIGLTDANQLLRFDSTSALNTTAVSISGLAAGESIVSIDYRNPDNTVYGLSSTGRLLSLNTTTGAATQVTTGLPSNGSASYEIDWNPSNNNLRIIGNGSTGNSNSAYTFGGTTTAQTSLTSPGVSSLDVVGAAYNNNTLNFAGTPTLFYIDAATDALYSTTNFAAGVLTKVGDLSFGGFTFGVSGPTGFDIASTGEAFISWRENLYTINLTSGALATLGSIGPNYTVIGITAVPEPGTYALMLAGIAAVGFVARRRKQG